MANEDDLRRRWGAVYRNSAEYQNALKQSAVDTAARRAKFDIARRGAKSSEELLAIGDQERAASQLAGSTIRGLNDYQDNRVNQYIADARKLGMEKSLSPALVSESPSYKRQQSDPDFSQHYPYGHVDTFALVHGAPDGDPADGEPDGGDDGSDLAQADTAGRSRARQSFGVEAPGSGGGLPDSLKAAVESRAYDAEQNERQKLIRYNTTVGRLAPDLQKLYNSLPGSEQDFILRKSPEEQQATLSSHPLRPKAVAPRFGSGPNGAPEPMGLTDMVAGIAGFPTGGDRGYTPPPNIRPTVSPPNRPPAQIINPVVNPFTPPINASR